jgi:hypothetical protein
MNHTDGNPPDDGAPVDAPQVALEPTPSISGMRALLLGRGRFLTTFALKVFRTRREDSMS